MSAEKNTEESAGYFPALTGVRWLAALMVFVLHYNTAPKGSILYYIFSGGSVGVSLFFVLSGFLITHKYRTEFKLDWKWMGGYLFKRFARIYPVYFLVSGIVLLLKLFYTQEYLSAGAVVLHFLLLQGYFEQSFAVLIAPAWSLTVEEAFYLSAPLFVMWSRKTSMFLVFSLLLFVGLGIIWLSAKAGAMDFIHSPVYLLDRTFFGRSLEFLIGGSLSFYISSGRKLKVGGVTYVSLLLIICFMYLQGGQFREYFHSPVILWVIKLRNYIFPWIAAMLFYGLITEKTWISRLFSTRLLLLLGKSSYAFYLVHLTIITPVVLRFIPQEVWALFLCLQLISIVIYLFWEQPARTFLLKRPQKAVISHL